MKTIVLLLILSSGVLAQTAQPFEPENPPLCDVPQGLAATKINGNSATLSWNPVNGATQYTIEIKDDQNEARTMDIATTVNSPNYTLTQLDPQLSYKYRVGAHCEDNISEWSPW